MRDYLIVFLGGGLGSMARLALARWLQPYIPFFPLGTWAANFIACTLLGFIAGIGLGKWDVTSDTRIFLAAGFCGGLSTFSTMELEILELCKRQEWLPAATYLLISLTSGILGMAGGLWTVQRI